MEDNKFAKFEDRKKYLYTIKDYLLTQLELVRTEIDFIEREVSILSGNAFEGFENYTVGCDPYMIDNNINSLNNCSIITSNDTTSISFPNDGRTYCVKGSKEVGYHLYTPENTSTTSEDYQIDNNEY